jgi:hypothetical protein
VRKAANAFLNQTLLSTHTQMMQRNNPSLLMVKHLPILLHMDTVNAQLMMKLKHHTVLTIAAIH